MLFADLLKAVFPMLEGKKLRNILKSVNSLQLLKKIRHFLTFVFIYNKSFACIFQDQGPDQKRH